VRVWRRGTTYKEVARCMRNVTQVSRANLDTTFSPTEHYDQWVVKHGGLE